MTETKQQSVPSSVDVPKGTGSAWSNGNKKKGNSGKTGSNSNSNSHSDTTTVDKQFRNDSQDLGVMYQRYFDCSSPHDQVRFTLTQERLSIYAGEKYQPFGKDFKAAIIDPTHKPTVPAVVMPTKTITNKDGITSVVSKTEEDLGYLDKLMLKEQVGLQVKKEMQLTGLKQTLFNFIYGRCTELLQDRIKSHKSYDELTRSSDPFDLLTTIREIVHQIESNSYIPLLLDDQLAAIYRLRQGNKTVSQYHTAFKSMIAALDTQGGSFGHHPATRAAAATELLAAQKISSASDLNNLSAEEKQLVSNTAREMYLAIRFMQGSDHQRFLPLLIDLKNNFAKGTNQFPQTVQKAVDLLLNWEKTHPSRDRDRNPGNGNRQQQQQQQQQSQKDKDKEKDNAAGVTLVNSGQARSKGDDKTAATETDNSTISTKQSDKSSKASTVKKGDKSGSMSLTITEDNTDEDVAISSFMFLESSNSSIPSSWLLLDSQSTLDLIKDPTILTNIRKAGRSMHVQSSG
mmetsp:Transcript_48922/g.118445  ORF Transcript_48922/g.118445 Transcript_48922/m.118445 type:complete len:514 (+) Transcript_48922:2958-4499(+)|eukprot:CAMPEP_0113471526 /NCGR_PEP_ID=MMETSP0014_2-20120614/17021_1 /TAXON_ID=2857 /ORGANISM="Nitzschia sp." /LENGTH=513 /DNA_ID=CAMNT_0000364159 /DNA_START=210 /DNA_END=1751 /DNA_ORIENTATION=+ /assembly_acc=CAM_ASM_000159